MRELRRFQQPCYRTLYVRTRSTTAAPKGTNSNGIQWKSMEQLTSELKYDRKDTKKIQKLGDTRFHRPPCSRHTHDYPSLSS